jgi:hypothetical protein
VEGAFQRSQAATDWRVRENVLCGYDSASASPDFENGAITGAFAYAAMTGEASDNDSRVQLAENDASGEECDWGPCHPIEVITVTASRTYFANINLELTFLIGSSINFGVYYNYDLLLHGRSPLGVYYNGSQTFGIAAGLSAQFGYAKGPFSNFTNSTSPSLNIGAGPISGSLAMGQSVWNPSEFSIGPGTGLKYGLSMTGASETYTSPVTIPDRLETIMERGFMPSM